MCKNLASVCEIIFMSCLFIKNKCDIHLIQMALEAYQKFVKTCYADLVFGEHRLWVLVLRSGPPCQVSQRCEAHLLQV